MDAQTPTSSGRPVRATRTPTPRLSERKRQLFRIQSSQLNNIEDADAEDSLLHGIAPLTPTKDGTINNNVLAGRSGYSARKLSDVLDQGEGKRLRSSTSSSPENNKENKSARKTRGTPAITSSTNDDQLQLLFKTTMRINSNSSSNASSPRTAKTRARQMVTSDVDTDSDDNDDYPTSAQKRIPMKRTHDSAATVSSSPESAYGSPQAKQLKTQKQCIPPMSFYSKADNNITASPGSRRSKSTGVADGGQRLRGQHSSGRTKVSSPRTRRLLGINKGVGHKIRKPQHPSSSATVNVDSILSSLRNDKLRQLITNKREERAKVEEVHEILRRAQNPIQMAKPLSIMDAGDANNNNSISKEATPVWQTSADFSDLSDDEEATAVEPIIPIIRHDNLNTSPSSSGNKAETLANRKFFKSGQRSSTCMEVRITDHIRASVSNGKIALMEAPQKMRRVRVKSKTKFSAEQATVDAILRDLDDSALGDIVEAATPNNFEEQAAVEPHADFRQRLPYRTDDAAIMEQQELLLEFLICNNICTEENFEIFIANPDDHKEQAARIVDELYMVLRTEEAAAAASIEPPPKLYPVFTQHLLALPQQSRRRKAPNALGLANAASGCNQYQIDAGQKAYGAKQCQQCGLVYTVHEPEEEQLHHEYHNSVHLLRFKGWIDEDVVAAYPEWASDGRIIRLTQSAPSVRLHRLAELIQLVDKELGYDPYTVTKKFAAYFAVRKQQIVGLCLVQPLSHAHRLQHIDGIDYFSEETYEASCGISRIWVAPLQRRRGIARKLLRAVQGHTILGSEIDMERIAFNAPCDEARAFLQHITRRDDFLIYQ